MRRVLSSPPASPRPKTVSEIPSRDSVSPSAARIIPNARHSSHSARFSASASRLRRAVCSCRNSRSADFASRIRLTACASHFRICPVSARRSAARSWQSRAQASADANCAASRPSATVTGNSEATAAMAAWSRRSNSAGSSVNGGGNRPRNIQRISWNAARGSNCERSGEVSANGALGNMSMPDILQLCYLTFNVNIRDIYPYSTAIPTRPPREGG